VLLFCSALSISSFRASSSVILLKICWSRSSILALQFMSSANLSFISWILRGRTFYSSFKIFLIFFIWWVTLRLDNLIAIGHNKWKCLPYVVFVDKNIVEWWTRRRWGSIRADSTNRWRGHLLESKMLLTVGWYSHYIITLKRIFDLVNSFKSYGKMKIDFFHFAVTKKMSDFFLF
jgi:hypothetical protein